MKDQNPLNTQQLTKNSKKVIKPIKTPINYPLKPQRFPQYGRQFCYSGKTPLMDYTRVQHVGISNCLKVSYSLDNAKNTLHSYRKYKVKGSGNSTLNYMFGVDPFAFDCSSTTSLLPRLTCIHKKTNQKLGTCISYMNQWVRCRNKT